MGAERSHTVTHPNLSVILSTLASAIQHVPLLAPNLKAESTLRDEGARLVLLLKGSNKLPFELTPTKLPEALIWVAENCLIPGDTPAVIDPHAISALIAFRQLASSALPPLGELRNRLDDAIAAVQAFGIILPLQRRLVMMIQDVQWRDANEGSVLETAAGLSQQWLRLVQSESTWANPEAMGWGVPIAEVIAKLGATDPGYARSANSDPLMTVQQIAERLAARFRFKWIGGEMLLLALAVVNEGAVLSGVGISPLRTIRDLGGLLNIPPRFADADEQLRALQATPPLSSQARTICGTQAISQGYGPVQSAMQLLTALTKSGKDGFAVGNYLRSVGLTVERLGRKR